MSNSTSSDGCVSCGPSPECPKCGDDEYCVVTTLTCTQCPTTHCAPRSSSQFSALSNSTANTTSATSTSLGNSGNGRVTRIVVGSVIGGLAGLVLLVALLVYQWYWKARQRNRQLQLKEGTLGLGLHPEEELDDLDDLDDLDLLTDDELDDLDTDDDEARDELGSLQEYVHGHGHGHPAPQYQDMGGLRPPRLNSGALGPFGPERRRSTASTADARLSRVSLASNLLPVAYIPGVTSAATNTNTNTNTSGTPGGTVSSAANSRGSNRRTPTSLTSAARLNVAGDTGSHITLGSSILGGLDDAWDSESVADGTLGTVKIGLGNNLTTAIKARAKLVQIHEGEGEGEGERSETEPGKIEPGDIEPGDIEPGEIQRTESSLPNESLHSDLVSVHSDDAGSFILDVGIDGGSPVSHGDRDSSAAAQAQAQARNPNPFDDAFEIQ